MILEVSHEVLHWQLLWFSAPRMCSTLRNIPFTSVRTAASELHSFGATFQADEPPRGLRTNKKQPEQMSSCEIPRAAHSPWGWHEWDAGGYKAAGKPSLPLPLPCPAHHTLCLYQHRLPSSFRCPKYLFFHLGLNKRNQAEEPVVPRCVLSWLMVSWHSGEEAFCSLGESPLGLPYFIFSV